MHSALSFASRVFLRPQAPEFICWHHNWHTTGHDGKSAREYWGCFNGQVEKKTDRTEEIVKRLAFGRLGAWCWRREIYYKAWWWAVDEENTLWVWTCLATHSMRKTAMAWGWMSGSLDNIFLVNKRGLARIPACQRQYCREEVAPPYKCFLVFTSVTWTSSPSGSRGKGNGNRACQDNKSFFKTMSC